MKNSLFIIILLFAFSACKSNQSNTNNHNEEVVLENEVEETQAPVFELLNTEDFKSKLASSKEYHLVDIRTAEELAENGTIEGAVNIDFYSPDFDEQIKKLNKDLPIFIFCRSGGRSAQASAKIKNEGFKATYELEGGYNAWLQNNKN